MKTRVFNVVILFLLIGLGSGLLGILVGILSTAWGWVGLGAILAPGLIVSVIIANRLQWIAVKLSLPRCILAALITVAAYLLSVLVMILGAVAYESLYSRLFPTEWHERVYSGA